MFAKLCSYLKKPQLYAPSTGKFWDDEYISQNMLKAHLNPDEDAATRRHDFLDKSTAWIANAAPPDQYRCLLDLGCGPGLYAERFYAAGYCVTGLDYSRRSIDYAKNQAALHGQAINYLYQNYLSMNYKEQFDVITLIYCDYAVLSAEDRLLLLKKIYQAFVPAVNSLQMFLRRKCEKKKAIPGSTVKTGDSGVKNPISASNPSISMTIPMKQNCASALW